MPTKNTPLLCALAVGFVANSAPVLADVPDDRADDGHIIVTATRSARQSDEVAYTLTQITDTQLQEQLADTFDDIVRYQPGLSMATATRGGNTGLIIRGIGGKRVLMLLDGVRASDVFFAGPAAYGNDLFELSNIESIEIIRGPASALYGSDALGGVVILDSKEADDFVDADKRWIGQLVSRANGAQDSVSLGANLARAWSNGGLLVQVNRREFAQLEIAGEGRQPEQDGRSDSILLKYNQHLNQQTELQVTLDAFNDSIRYDLAQPGEAMHIGHDDSERLRFSIGMDTNLDSTWSDALSAKVFWQSTDALQNTLQLRDNSFSFPAFPFGTGNATLRASDFEFNQDVSGLILEVEKLLAEDTWQLNMTYGLDWENIETERPRNRCETDTVTSATTCAIVPYPFAPAEVFPNKTFPDTTTKKLGLFWQGEWSLQNTDLTFIPGLRYDRIEMDADSAGMQTVVDFGFPIVSTQHDKFTPSLGVIYQWQENTQWVLQYARGFRAPNYDEANQSFANLAFGYAIVPNPELTPESSEGLEISLRHFGANYEFSFNLYNNRYRDFIETEFFSMQNGLMLFRDENLARVDIRGLEMRGLWQANEYLSIDHALAYAEGKDKVNDVYLDSIEPASAFLGINYLAEQWRLALNVTAFAKKDKVSAPDRVTAPGYTLFDLVASYEISDSALLRMGVFNLGDKQYARWANIQGLPADSSSLPDLQQPGRHFRVMLQINF